MTENYHEEESLGKAYDSHLMKRLLRYLKPYKILVGVSVLLLLFISALELAGPILVKFAIDVPIAQNDLVTLNKVGLLYIAIILIGFALHYFQLYMMNYIGQKAMYDLSIAVFSHIQKLSLSYFDRTPVGRLMTRVTNDVQVLNELFTSGLVAIFGDVFTLIGITVVLLVLNWKLALVSFSVLPILIYASFLFRRKVREAYRKIRIKLARINSFLQENITGMSVVQLFTREEKNFRKFDRINRDHKDAYVESIFYYAVFFPTVEILSSLAVALIIWYGGGKLIEGILTFGALVAFIQYSQRFFQPIRDLSEKYNIMQTAMASSERIFKLLDIDEIIPEPKKPAKREKFEGEIEFKNVWFAYKENEFVLKDISFTVPAGSSVAIVGATGAGKTTLTNLLARFYDVQRGQILLDGTDVREIETETLREQLSIVLQDVFMFSGTVADNIRLGSEEIPDLEVSTAAEEIRANTFIERLPNRYQEEIRERGSNLSVGQKQLLAFTRALAFDPTILILDEATSSVDTETEILIQQGVRRLMRGRTSIIIAHRLSTIQNADKIIVMHKGEIREMGTHQELLAQRGIYYKLYQLQYKDQEIRYTHEAAV